MSYLKYVIPDEPFGRGRSLLGDLPIQQTDGHHRYDPNQPRVPRGHSDGGQWTREGVAGPAEPNPNRFWPPGVQYAAAGAGVLPGLIPDNVWPPDTEEVAGGNDNNIQHSRGIEAAKRELVKLGYSVIGQEPVAVDVPGFDTPRFYDFIVRHPDTGGFIGVEVKTTLREIINLKADQVLKDAAVMASSGTVRTSGLTIGGVYYLTYCGACEQADLRSSALKAVLDAAKIPYSHGKGPWQKRP